MVKIKNNVNDNEKVSIVIVDVIVCLTFNSASKREQRRVIPDLQSPTRSLYSISAEPTNAARAELCWHKLCLARRRKTKSTGSRIGEANV